MNSQPDKVDRLLTDFFRAELPSTWPEAPPIRAAMPVAGRGGDSLSHSRMALAASIAAMLIGGWLLSGRMSAPPNRPASFEDTTATRPAEMRLGK
jgi:hypothetical protein